MATRIYFAADRGDRALTLDVEEDVDKVFQAWTAAGGLPFDLTESRGSSKVWINPDNVAYWQEAPSRTAQVG
jgi:hypothetical protein